MMKPLVILLSFLCLAACERYPGFNQSGDIYFKLEEIGDDTIKAKPGDYIAADISFKTILDSQFFNAAGKFQLHKPMYSGSIENCIMMLAAGDKAAFIISAENFYKYTLRTSIPSFFHPGDDINIDIKINDIQTAQDFNSEKGKLMKWAEKFPPSERSILINFMDRKSPVTYGDSGFYRIRLQAGNKHRIEAGKMIDINFLPVFLNGRYVDTTGNKQSLNFVYGTEMQVLSGLDKALGNMSEGEKALIITASKQAWNLYDSAQNAITPYSSAIFEIEVVSVKENN